MLIPDSRKLRFYDDKKKEYSISELTEATGIKPRTIYFYVQEGVIPGPSGAGSSARYGEEHRIKLLLITKLKNELQMNLKVIRQLLDNIEFVHSRLPGVPAIPVGEDELDVILSHFSETATKSKARRGMVAEKAYYAVDEVADMDMSGASLQEIPAPANANKRMNYNLWKSAQQQFSPEASSEEGKTWRKEMIVDGMDLFVRSDIEKRHGVEIRNSIMELRQKIKKTK
jgi:DNA-binding transcriptional MerR regulator